VETKIEYFLQMAIECILEKEEQCEGVNEHREKLLQMLQHYLLHHAEVAHADDALNLLCSADGRHYWTSIHWRAIRYRAETPRIS
jgi:hypothetical protein